MAGVTPHETRRDGFLFTDARFDLDAAHAMIARSYWAKGIPRETFARSVANSTAFGVFEEATSRQVALARVISDKATYAYLCDVFVHEDFRGRGLSKNLVAHILAHPDFQGLRRCALITRDAHGVYTPFGFAAMDVPTRYMEKVWRVKYDA